jgi:chromosome segregation ATPase
MITMLNIRKTLVVLASIVPLALLPGCSSEQKSVETIGGSDPVEIEKHDSVAVARRFKESTPKSPTAVETAIELSEKYARLSEEAAALRRQNQQATALNEELRNQAATLRSQLEQTQKELAQANDLLIEMRIELNNWKADILGFRDEMRKAETAQLETLFKILKVLGGQVETEVASGQSTGDIGSAATSANRSYNP